MARNRDKPLIDEEKEKARIKWENDVLFILMPTVGLIAFIMGLVGAILVFGSDKDIRIPIGIFLIILAVLGAGGITYGVLQFLKRRKNKANQKANKKEQPNQ